MNLKAINERLSKIESSFPPDGIIENFEGAVSRATTGVSNNNDEKFIYETLKKHSANNKILNCYRAAVSIEMQRMI